MNKQVLYAQRMNIGGRIEKRLSDLKWERKDLLARVPDLSAQALSNLIVRDSVRSEWDESIAEALGVSVMWLVYGKHDANLLRDPAKPNYNPALTTDEEFILRAYRAAGIDGKAAIMFLAKQIIPDPNGFEERTGTK